MQICGGGSLTKLKESFLLLPKGQCVQKKSFIDLVERDKIGAKDFSTEAEG